MKILCFYLPQYHEVKENNEWWGKGYTDWVASKSATKLYKNHKQPRTPLNNNYYDLADESANTWKWQAELANQNDIYGFCIYHYWFTGKQLLEKPMEILLNHPEININYSICWANAEWRMNWYGAEKKILMPQNYGEQEDWNKHFKYLLQFFRDERYIKIGNKPVIHIYMAHQIECLEEMRLFWEKSAIENGYDGIYLVAGNTAGFIDDSKNYIDAYYNFEPGHAFGQKRNKLYFKIFVWWKAKIIKAVGKLLKKDLFENIRNIKRVYKLILCEKITSKKKVYLGICPEYDDSPRRQIYGNVYKGSTPKLFEKTLFKLIKKSAKLENEFIYINAWNEWGETAYLEPDEERGYEYLEAIKTAQEKFKSI